MTDKEAIKSLIGLLKDFKRTICIIIFCLFLSTFINLCMPIISSKIMDEGLIGENRTKLVNLVLLVLVLFLVSSVLDLVKEKKRIDIANSIKMQLEEKAFVHLMKMKLIYFRDKNYAELLNNLNTDIRNMTAIADNNVFFVFTQILSMIGGVIGLSILDYRLTILVLFFMPIKYFVMQFFIHKRKKYVSSYIKEEQEYSGWFGDVIGGVKEVKLFGIFNNKLVEFQNRKSNVIEKEKKIIWLEQWNGITASFLVQIMMALIYILGADLVFDAQLSIGNVFAFITYSTYVTSPISALLNIGYYLSGIIPSTKRYYDLMNCEEETSADILEQDEKEMLGDIEYRDVTFSYDDGKQIVSNLSFTIPFNKKIAIIGSNGAGKSTLLDLLLRIYEPQKGDIYIEGSNIQNIPIEKYRSMISVVSQDIYLFNDTIRNNIALYKDIKDEVIKEACLQSGLKDLVDDVSLDYCVGCNGVKLSGGQKQKIALARALIHDRPIVIFDEATSSADRDSIKQINSLLHTVFKNKTVIVVSHQKEILKDVDYVFQLEQGKIIQSVG